MERKKQALVIRAEMLRPIEDWLKGSEKIVGIFSDTLSTVAQNEPLPIHYDLSERKKANIFMSEKTNEVLGIVASDSLQIRETKRLAIELAESIKQLDYLIKFELLPRENEIVERSNNFILTESYILDALKMKMQVDLLLQKTYSLVARLKTALT